MKRLRRKYYHWRADMHLLSFPKCGRTWLRLMLGRLIEEQFGVHTGNSLQLHKLGDRRRGIPSILASHDFQVIRSGVRKRELDTDKTRFAGKRVLLMIRDPRDTIVSFYHHKTLRERSFDGSISEFIRQDFDGLSTIIDYYNVWAENRHIPSALEFVRYEDLRTDTMNTLRHVAEFAGITSPRDETLQQSVAEFEFDRMKKMEAQGQLGEGHTKRPADPNVTNSFKTRAGLIGGYRQELCESDLRYVDEMVLRRLDDFYASYKTRGNIVSAGNC